MYTKSHLLTRVETCWQPRRLKALSGACSADETRGHCLRVDTRAAARPDAACALDPGETISEGGFQANKVSAASLLDVQSAKDKNGKTYYKYEILTRTGACPAPAPLLAYV